MQQKPEAICPSPSFAHPRFSPRPDRASVSLVSVVVVGSRRIFRVRIPRISWRGP